LLGKGINLLLELPSEALLLFLLGFDGIGLLAEETKLTKSLLAFLVELGLAAVRSLRSVLELLVSSLCLLGITLTILACLLLGFEGVLRVSEVAFKLILQLLELVAGLRLSVKLLAELVDLEVLLVLELLKVVEGLLLGLES